MKKSLKIPLKQIIISFTRVYITFFLVSYSFAAETLPPFHCTLTCPPDIETRIQEGVNGVVVSCSPAIATDNDGKALDIHIAYSIASGTVFNLGLTTVSATVYDPTIFRRTQCRFRVTVRTGRKTRFQN